MTSLSIVSGLLVKCGPLGLSALKRILNVLLNLTRARLVPGMGRQLTNLQESMMTSQL